MIFGFHYFSDDPPLDNDGDEKDEQDKYSVDKDDHDDEDSNEEQGDHAPPQKKSKKKPSYLWRKTKPPARYITFLGNEFLLSPAEELSPIQYFKQFWSNNITGKLTTETNIYLVQKSGKCIDTNGQDIERFIGIQMLMSIISLPSYQLYWSKDLCIDCVTNLMSLKRYELIRRYLLANDNKEKKDDSSRLFKVQPVVHALRTNCLSVDQQQYQSIDEQMVPAKTKRSGIHQYLPNKIHKWGFKNFVPAGASEIIYDFFFYAGQKSAGKEKCSASEVVLQLIEELPKNQNYLWIIGFLHCHSCQSSKPWEFYQLPPFDQIALVDAH